MICLFLSALELMHSQGGCAVAAGCAAGVTEPGLPLAVWGSALGQRTAQRVLCRCPCRGTVDECQHTPESGM